MVVGTIDKMPDEFKDSCHDDFVKRQKNDLYWLSVASKISEKSKCQKRQVGGVLLDKMGRVISTAYNFHPRKTKLDHICFRKDIPTGEQMHIGACCHADVSLLIFANFNEMQNGSMYLTAAPCEACAPYILQAGLDSLVYYKSDIVRPDGVNLIRQLTDKIDIRIYDKSN